MTKQVKEHFFKGIGTCDEKWVYYKNLCGGLHKIGFLAELRLFVDIGPECQIDPYK